MIPRGTLSVRSLRLHDQPQLTCSVSGVLLDNAQELANAQRPEPTYEQLWKRFDLTVRDAISHGLTSLHDAGFDPRSLNFFRRYVIAIILTHHNFLTWR